MSYDMGFNLMDRRSTLLDLCFADDIFIFVQVRVEAGNLLDPLVEQLDRISLLLNAYQRVVTTDEAQSPLQPRLESFSQFCPVMLQKWLGSMFDITWVEVTRCGFTIYAIIFSRHLRYCRYCI